MPGALSFADGVADVGVRPSSTQTALSSGFGVSAQDSLFDVLLHWAPTESEQDHRFWHVQRSLADFEHLNAQLTRDQRTAQQAAFPAQEIWQFKRGQDQSTQHVTIQQEQHRELRLGWALECYLRQALGDAALSNVMALKKFIHTDIVASNESSGAFYQQQIAAQCDARRATTQGDECVAAGCSFDHTIPISSPEEDRKTIVFWKFRSNPHDQLVFSASFSPQQSGPQVNDSDPYAAADGFAETFTRDADPASVTQEAVHYRTPYDFAGANSFASGHFVVDRPGELTFCWENVDMSSIVSKQLRFEVHVVPIEPVGELEILLALLDEIHNEDDPMWLASMLKQSPLQTLEDAMLLTQEEDEPEQEDGWSVVDTPSMATGPQNVQYQQRTMELEGKVHFLEDQVAGLKQELKRAQDLSDTTDAIYKASLETISQLEHELFQQRRQQQSNGFPSNGHDSSPSPIDDEDDDYNDEEDEEERAEEEAAEITRLRNLCATFQEQCLWRSIETAESEKQRLTLEAQLAQVKEQHDQLNERLQAHEEALVQLKTQNRTLRAHKTLLVQEVKKLQPFSQVNVATLMMDAQEARMMQRSLQARLDAVQLSDQSQQQGQRELTNDRSES